MDVQYNHKFNNILINEFEKTQMINIKNIKCNLCVLMLSIFFNSLNKCTFIQLFSELFIFIIISFN